MSERIEDSWTYGVKDRQTRWRYRAAKAGRCCRCAQQREPGYTHCRRHLEAARLQSQKTYQKKQDALRAIGVFRGSQWRGNMPDTLTYHRVRIARAIRKLDTLPDWSTASAQRLLWVVYVGDTPWVLGMSTR
jgi:hypothetical protein